jgi:rubredoxin
LPSANSTHTLSIPDIGALSDEEMARLFPHADGRWSEQTKALMARHGTTKLALNASWARTWQDWTCPCCRRHKRDIVRVTAGGVLLCQLEWHHDHLEDYARKLIGTMAPPVREVAPDDGDVSRVFRIEHREQIMGLLHRFERTLICIDCNLADAQAKQELRREMDKDFSFTPREIQSFIQVAPNRPHEIDVQKAWLALTEANAEFHDLMHFARLMGERLSQGRHRREIVPSQHSLRHRGAELRAILWDQCPDVSENDLEMQFSDRSVARDGDGSSLREKPKPKATAPSADVFAKLDASMKETSKTWAEAGEAWCCTACGRSKFEIARKSRKNEWVAKVQTITDYDLNDDVHDESGPLLEVTGFAHVGICQDCRIIVTQTKQALNASNPNCLTIADLQKLTQPAQPHRMHDYDTAEAIRMARANAPIHEAIARFKGKHQLDAGYPLA